MLGRLEGAIYFSRIDLKLAYYQIQIANEDVHKTTMRTRYGPYEFLIMLFKLCNAPATFMFIMNERFHEEIDECVVVYINDVLVYSKNKLDHVRDLRRVLEKPRQHKLYANAEKSEFALKELEFLGYVLSDNGIRPDSKKIQTIRD